MFGIGPLELIVILALALILLGPEKFPEAGRAVGRAMREFRSVTNDLTRELNTAFEEPPPRVNTPDTAISYEADVDATTEDPEEPERTPSDDGQARTV